jgi:hypothetical protein
MLKTSKEAYFLEMVEKENNVISDGSTGAFQTFVCLKIV